VDFANQNVFLAIVFPFLKELKQISLLKYKYAQNGNE